MIVRPELMSASSAPSTSPLNICETRLLHVNTEASGVVAQLAAEGVRFLHQWLARQHLEDLPVILLALHVGGLLAAHDDDRADELMVFGPEMDLADGRLDLRAALVDLDDSRRIEGARGLDRVG